MALPTGVWAASLTPLDERLAPDHERLVEHAEQLLTNGCDGVLVFGTTGEAPSFSVAERQAALAALVDGGIEPSRIMVGTGCAALSDTVELTRHALSTGVDKTLIIPPFFLKEPPAAGVWDWYREVIQRVDADEWQLHLYNFPRLSGIPITADLVHSLREFHADVVVGVKDSSGDITSLHGFLGISGFSVMTGTERLLVEAIRLGASGVITATANVNAPDIAAVYQAAMGRSETVDDRKMLAARSVIESYSPIPAMKAVLAERTGYSGWSRVRPPLLPMAGENERALMMELAAIHA